MCVMIDIFENQGIEKGKAEGKAEDIIELLEECGTVPEWLKAHIMQETDVDKLKTLLKLSAKVESIEEFIEKSGMNQF